MEEQILTRFWVFAKAIIAATDPNLDLAEIEDLLVQGESGLDAAPNRVRYTMIGFVSAVGTHVRPLTKRAKTTARRIGAVEVELGGTSCKVPLATEKIAKVEKAGRTGKKRKSIKC